MKLVNISIKKKTSKPAPAKKEAATKPTAKKPATKTATKTATKKPAAKKPAKKEEVNYRNYHVSKRADGKWAVKYAGGEKAIKLFATQKEAIEYTKVMAENQGGVMLVHNSKGKSKGRIK